ncbi:MAG: type II secretion system GspH family protein [Firmicutes bacterium]|nr:type II secretion system GspH family protein [Bacillota bacterium]
MNRRVSSESGFTLIEVIVVVLLLGIAAAMVLPRGYREATTGAALDTEAQKLAGVIRLARQKAVAGGRTYKVHLSTDNYHLAWQIGDGPETDEPLREIDSHVIITKFPANRAIVFEPHGNPSTEVYTIILSDKGDGTATKTIEVNGLGTVDIK